MEDAGPKILGTGAKFKQVPCQKNCRVNRAIVVLVLQSEGLYMIDTAFNTTLGQWDIIATVSFKKYKPAGYIISVEMKP